MFLQKKPVMQVLAANILMGIRNIAVIVKLGRATRMDKIRFVLNVKKFILCSGWAPMKAIRDLKRLLDLVLLS